SGIFAGYGNLGASTKVLTANASRLVAVDPLASGMLNLDSLGSMFAGAARSTAPLAAPHGASSDEQQLSSSEQSEASALLDAKADAAASAVEIEDTPVQYACRTMLALQIMEYVCRAKDASKAGTIDVARERQTIADTLRLPLSPPTVPKPTSPAASSATPAEKSGIRDPNTQFTTAPKPAAKKKRHTFRNATLLALAAGSGFVAAAAYAQKDSEFDQKFEHYVPGAKSFMNLIRYHDDSIVMALSDVGFKAYDDT
ncbi:hypothetical protein GGH92_009622, partial [Coemansia sp. RSA 2673]